jgi:DNA polymerase III delta prime subunit
MVGIRDLITKTELLPYEGVRQVFLIEEAESLSPVCQNALLKLLEEPPTGTYLFLVCTHTAYLLPTLLSRCTILRFFSVRSLIMSESRASALIQRVLVDNLHGVGGVWHELQLELDTLSIQQGLDLLEDILIWARHQFLLPCVYDLVIEAREQLQFHVKLRHVIEALLLKISVTGTLS